MGSFFIGLLDKGRPPLRPPQLVRIAVVGASVFVLRMTISPDVDPYSLALTSAALAVGLSASLLLASLFVAARRAQ